jgi:hypothetical protein
MNRRMYDGGLMYTHNASVLHWNVVQGYASWALGLFQIPFIINFFSSIKWGRRSIGTRGKRPRWSGRRRRRRDMATS